MSKRVYKKLPCKKCPTFVMCRSANPLTCKLLYNFLFDEHIVPVDSTFYRRIKQIKLMFNKRYYNYFVNSKHELGMHWLLRSSYGRKRG